ncbi:hypothetical protein diail_10504 [Diaporthe ilicicola]|nr:hypothetical protein diail_10504 [Diaporthe ilicicola]
MDTRSVIRSRRRSTRLSGQSPDGDHVEETTTNKKRSSKYDAKAKPGSDASRQDCSSQTKPNSSNASTTQKARSEPPNAITNKALTKDENNDTIAASFPDVRSSTQFTRAKTAPNTSIADVSGDHSSKPIAKDHVGTKWVKTARGSIRLASDSPDGTKHLHGHGHEDGDAEERQESKRTDVQRRSSRLASMTPDVEDVAKATSETESNPPRIKTKSNQGFITATSIQDPLESGSKQLSSSSKSTPTRATLKEDRTVTTTQHDELPIRSPKSQRFIHNSGSIEGTSPIPELVADIEKIISSSPIANQGAADDGSKGTARGYVSTMSDATKLLISKSLANHKHQNGVMARLQKLCDPKQTDLNNLPLDGASDDSIQDRTQEAQAAHFTVNKKSTESRGTKRNVDELSHGEDDADTPRLRQRRMPDSDESKRGVEVSSADSIEEVATPQNAFPADEPSVESSQETGDFAYGSGERVNSVLPAQMLSANPERMGGSATSAQADDGSQAAAASQPQIPEDTLKCADCGRAPERYLVCAKCEEVIYCGKYCQIWNWPIHKTRCVPSDEADQAEVELQDAYLEEMWSAALEMLREEENAGGTLDSVLLGEAVRHSPTNPSFMGLRNSRGFAASDVDASRSTPLDEQAMDRTRAMSMRLAQAAQGHDEELSEAE